MSVLLRSLLILRHLAALMVCTTVGAKEIARVSLVNSTPASASHQLDDLQDQRIVLHRNAGSGNVLLVSVGIPFAPGVLRDTRLLRILDAHGAEVPAAIQTTLTWYARDGSVRAVRAQFRVGAASDRQTFYFALGEPRKLSLAGWPYTLGLVADDRGQQVPAVVATLAPAWLCRSLIAGPQQPAAPDEPYANYVAKQFRWAARLPQEDETAWLFDRPGTLFQAYVRTGRADYLAAAEASYRFYMSHLRRQGIPGWPMCGGGWSLGKVSACDTKYIYVEPTLLALGLTGDDSEYDPALIERMIGAWDIRGWHPVGPYARPGQRFTEREAGLGLLATVSAYEITGDKRFLQRIDDRLGWLYQHQQHNPDRLGNDGSWRNSWQMHEGDSYDAATDVRGTSPWMSENIIDGLWHAWLVTGDNRIPAMITGYGRYLERHGWIDLKTITDKEKDWRNPCSGPEGQISWYWSSAHASAAQLVAIQNSEGWYSDAHNVEMTLPVAAARYFETDPVQKRALDQRLALLSRSYSLNCAANSSTPRRFNWNNRGVGVVQWFMHQFGNAKP